MRVGVEPFIDGSLVAKVSLADDRPMFWPITRSRSASMTLALGDKFRHKQSVDARDENDLDDAR